MCETQVSCKFPVLYMHFLFHSRSCFHSLVRSFSLFLPFILSFRSVGIFSKKKNEEKKTGITKKCHYRSTVERVET